MLTEIQIAKCIVGPNDATHIGDDKLRELQDIQWGRLKSQEQLHYIRAAGFILELVTSHMTQAFVVANADGSRFRTMVDIADGSGDYIDWTADLDKSLWFARREDAEAFAKDDEDAWRILSVSDAKNGQRLPSAGAVPTSGTSKSPPPGGTSPTDPRCLPVDAASTEDVLRIFRQFVSLNATQWAMGAGDHHHPMWEWLSERIETEDNTSGPDWAFIQPMNRKRHNVLTDEYLDFVNSSEAEKRGG